MPMHYLALLATVAVLPTQSVKVEKIDYKGWGGSYKVSNGSVELVVVPQIGRVMSYGFVGGANVIWQNDALVGKTFAPDARTYRNYGGDKLWPAPQSAWNWPPDPGIDGTPWTVEPISNGVRMVSGIGTKTRVQFRREITLNAFNTEVTFRNSMENKGPRQEYGIWQVTQINDPDSISMPLEVTPAQPKGWHGFGKETLNPTYHTLAGASGRSVGVLTIKRDPKQDRKFGSRALKGVLTAALDSVRFISESQAYDRVKYPDQGSAQQVYTAADPMKYAELEHAGPLTRMERNEMVLQTVKWRLEKG